MSEFTDIRFDTRVLRSAQALADAGYHIDLLMFNSSISQYTENVKGNIVNHEFAFPYRYKTQGFLARLTRLLKAGIVIIQINLWILMHRADYYHAHNLYFLWSSVLSAIIHKAKMVYDAHELHSEHYEGFSGRLENKFNELYERIFIPGCDVFIQASPERAEFIEKKYHIKKPFVINNYVPKEIYKNSTDRIRQECKIAPDEIIIYFSGKVLAPGGRHLDHVIVALSQLPGVHLAILGFLGDPLRNELLKIARENSVLQQLHFLPPCPPSEVYDYAVSADIGVIPLWGTSINTKMSALNKLSEYLMAGLPIACSSFPNLVNLVRNNPVGPVGETFDVLSPDSIASTICSIIKKREQENYRENALKLAQTVLNWELEEQKLLEIYNQIK
jgi:hypothetical protein